MSILSRIGKRTERAAAGTMRFLFAPQLGAGLGHCKMILAAFVQIIAHTLATAKLLPPTHRALNPQTPSDARLGEVLAVSYANLRSATTARFEKLAVFSAVTSLMVVVTGFILTAIGYVCIGVAHAGISIIVSLTIGDASCSGTSSSVFIAPCGENDMAQQWIQLLFNVPDMSTTSWSWGTTPPMLSGAIRDGLATMFQLYSTAMLVIAGFLILYHIISIVAATAHEGRFGGRSMNQIWAPVRLVVAVGLLVPLGTGNGFNSGQYIVTYIAKWGAGLASNVWAGFTGSLTADVGAFLIAPPLPTVAPLMKDALKVLTCKAAYDDLGDKAGGAFSVEASSSWKEIKTGSTSDGLWVYKSWDYKGSGSDSQPNVCGSAVMPNPNYSSAGEYINYLGGGTYVFNLSEYLRKGVLQKYQSLLDAAMDTSASYTAPTCPSGSVSLSCSGNGCLWALAHAIYWSYDYGNCFEYQQSYTKYFSDAVDKFRGDVGTQIASLLSSSAADVTEMNKDANRRGWVSAGVWFNAIARVNGSLIDVMQQLPSIQSDYQLLLNQKDANTLKLAMDGVETTLGSLLGYSSSGQVFSSGDGGFGLGYSGMSANSMLDAYLNMLSSNMVSSLGQASSGFTNQDVSAGGNVAAFQFNTANPLAEMAAMGYRLIDLAFKTNEAIEACAKRGGDSPDKTGSGSSSSDGSTNSRSICDQIQESSVISNFLMASIVGLLVSAGVTLAFVLPLIPFIRFMFGILTWVLSLFETVIAVPVIALAHIKMDGEGLAGPLARSGYMLLLQLFLRPTLMIFGLIVSLMLFNLMILALNEFYTGAVRSIENSGRLGALSGVMWSVIYGAMAYALANASFKAIDFVPNRALQWIGGPSSQTVDESGTVMSAAGRVGGLGNSMAQGSMYSGRHGGRPALGSSEQAAGALGGSGAK